MDQTLLRKTEFVADKGETQLEQVYVRSLAVVSRRVAGETLIVPVRGKVGDLASIYSFNQTGSLIWQSMETPKTLPDLIKAVQQEYAVGYEQAEQDVKQFLQDTLSAGLVELREQVSMAAMNSTGQGELQSAGSH
ncbi:MAG TPA: PqqD family protein [Candidatus Sulfotelmatobacter sp.]|nr:PqqD family protein [Candidatus Sulfotelmatobacter sp.]